MNKIQNTKKAHARVARRYQISRMKKYLLCFSIAGASSLASAVDVDTELLLLVDVSGSVDSAEYSLMMDGYEAAFRNSSVVSAIQSGNTGSVAISLVFWSGASQQSVGVDWMLVNDTASANAFADAIALTSRPFSGSTAIGSGINYATPLFGTETGGADNGFTSAAQIIDVSGDGEDNNTPPAPDYDANVRAARDAAIAAGVDMINGLPIGNAGGDLEGYYQDNIIAGSAGGVAAFTQTASTFSDIESSLTTKLVAETTAGANLSLGVPEPSSVLLIALGASVGVLRRKR